MQLRTAGACSLVKRVANSARVTDRLGPQPVTVQILNFTQEQIFGVSRAG